MAGPPLSPAQPSPTLHATVSWHPVPPVAWPGDLVGTEPAHAGRVAQPGEADELAARGSVSLARRGQGMPPWGLEGRQPTPSLAPSSQELPEGKLASWGPDLSFGEGAGCPNFPWDAVLSADPAAHWLEGVGEGRGPQGPRSCSPPGPLSWMNPRAAGAGPSQRLGCPSALARRPPRGQQPAAPQEDRNVCGLGTGLPAPPSCPRAVSPAQTLKRGNKGSTWSGAPAPAPTPIPEPVRRPAQSPPAPTWSPVPGAQGVADLAQVARVAASPKVAIVRARHARQAPQEPEAPERSQTAAARGHPHGGCCVGGGSAPAPGSRSRLPAPGFPLPAPRSPLPAPRSPLSAGTEQPRLRLRWAPPGAAPPSLPAPRLLSSQLSLHPSLPPSPTPPAPPQVKAKS